MGKTICEILLIYWLCADSSCVGMMFDNMMLGSGMFDMSICEDPCVERTMRTAFSLPSVFPDFFQDGMVRRRVRKKNHPAETLLRFAFKMTKWGRHDNIISESRKQWLLASWGAFGGQQKIPFFFAIVANKKCPSGFKMILRLSIFSQDCIFIFIFLWSEDLCLSPKSVFTLALVRLGDLNLVQPNTLQTLRRTS